MHKTIIVPLCIAVLILMLPPFHGTSPALALSNGLTRTPPMGWNSWNYFGCQVSETVIQHVADAMASNGMQAAGYQYIVIDDCWGIGRDTTGTMVANAHLFPHGIAAVAQYVHHKGFKLGIYTDAGATTCQGGPGSYHHEQQDARTFAAWGIDFLKEDFCNAHTLDPQTQYTIMRDALAATGRPIVLSICDGLATNTSWQWGPMTGNMWRSGHDLQDQWWSLLTNLDANAMHAKQAGPGGWNDPDMLQVGNGGMTENEYQVQVSMWALMAAPLIAGNNVTEMTHSTHDLLTNPEVLAVDQDPLGKQGFKVSDDGAGLQVWSKPLQQDGARAVALLNRSEGAATITASWNALGLAAGHALVRDLWQRADVGTFADSYRATVPAHSVVMLKVVSGPASTPTPRPLPTPPPPPTGSFDFANTAYSDLWQRTESLVQHGAVSYSWIWGPAPFTAGVSEEYAQSPGSRRLVQYFDKSRMEINQPAAAPGPYYVTNGRLADELITGLRQIGDAQYVQYNPAAIPIAGDPQNTFPLYKDLQRVYRRPRTSAHADELIYRGTDSTLQVQAFPKGDADPSMTIVQRVAGLGIPQIFWQFMNQPGSVSDHGQISTVTPLYDWRYVVGEPLTEAYWTVVTVHGVSQGVLVQAFERRVLTYTPANSAPFQVEMGNIGRHSFEWRYGVRP